MSRSELARVVRSWDAYEQARGARAVVDYDVAPQSDPIEPARDRLEVHERLAALQGDADDPVLGAHQAYLAALLGERWPLDRYLRATQGCPAAGWPEEYVTAVGERARAELAACGVSWGSNTEAELRRAQQPIDIEEARERILGLAAEIEPQLSRLAGPASPYEVRIELVDLDDYWAYWIDGRGDQVRLRFNRRNANFTAVRLAQFAQHEILGHARQFSGYAHGHQRGTYLGPEALAVHQPYQILAEGMAQAMPLLLQTDDPVLAASVRLDHYRQLVNAELHRALDDGAPTAACVAHARARIPWWAPNRIADALSDRGVDVMLRSYLWSYPAGMDWFVRLADDGNATLIAKVLRAAYERPLTPPELEALWPTGPRIGGPGAPVRLRVPALS